MTRHVQIDRLELDLRGLDPAVVEAAVRALGPALQRELAQMHAVPRQALRCAARIDAGHLPATVDARGLTHELAQRIAVSVNPEPKD